LGGGVRVRRADFHWRTLPRPRVGLRVRLRLLHPDDVRPSAGLARAAVMRKPLSWIAGAALVLLPFVYTAPYPLHILIIILIWSFAYTSWSVMGRFGLVSLGHGGVLGAGACCAVRTWYRAGLETAMGAPPAPLATVEEGVMAAYPGIRYMC